MITDTYPNSERRKHLFILDVAANRAARIASYHASEQYRGDWRCDLHPRWSRDSKQVCIDSVHEGIRQVYLIDLAMPAPTDARALVMRRTPRLLAAGAFLSPAPCSS